MYIHVWTLNTQEQTQTQTHTSWLSPLHALVIFSDLRPLSPSSLLPAAPSGRMSVLKSLQSLDPSHRISDRDYTGWMDFGRRSAEDYEYPS